MSTGVRKQISCFSMVPWRLSFQYFDQASNSFKYLNAKPGEAPVEAISEGDKYSINPDLCTECGTCADACPSDCLLYTSLARAFKLIEQREKLREKFSNDPNMVRPAICTSDKDKEFADRLQMVMDQQIGNAQFTIDEFASMMGLGRTVFYRKVRGVTGYSPNEYIRIIRMKKAAELLLENRYTVAEVSYKVGINDPFYFSKCFKQQFGVAPSVYLRGKEESGIQETENKE